MRPTLLVLALAIGIASPLCADEPELRPVELTIQAQAIESPVLKYRLIPTEAELKPGNAVPILLRLPWEESEYFSKVVPTLAAWDSRTPADPEWKKFPGTLPDAFYLEMKRAAFRRDATWEYPIGEQPGYLIYLPDLNGLRHLLGFGLSAKVRYHLLQGELDQARECILVGLANARHMAATPFYVNQIVAGVTCNLMFDRTADLIAQPKSPNLYWALSTLPDSLLELRRSATFEANSFALSLPAANDLDRPRDRAEWKKMLTQLRNFLKEFDADTKDPTEADRAQFVRDARAELPQLLRLPAENIREMSDEEVMVRWYVRVRTNHDHRVAAVVCLQPREAWPRLQELQAEVQAVNKKQGAIIPLFNHTEVIVAGWSLERKIQALRIVEAVRHYLASHNGRFPDSLTDIKDLSIPLDPLTGAPFEWQVKNNVATLKAPTPPDNAVLSQLEQRRGIYVAYRLIVAITRIADAKANDDGENIQGSWKIESAQHTGRTAPVEEYKSITIVITANKLTWSVADKAIGEMTYKLDASKGWIDLTDVKSKAQHVSQGIYELKGDDLKICFPEASKERSTAFESKADGSPNDVYLVLKREKT